MAVARRMSRQALKSAGVSIATKEVKHGMIQSVLKKVAHLDDDKKQAAIIEFATRHWLHLLAPISPLYPKFKDLLWQDFSQEPNLLEKVLPLIGCQGALDDAKARYYDYVRQAFRKSGKSRDEFYDRIFSEFAIQPELGSVGFGEKAMLFNETVRPSLHREHFLVWYSVRLLIKAHRGMYPRSSQITDERLEEFYCHFEEAMPLEEKFSGYASNDSCFNSALKFLLLPMLL